MKIQIYWNLRDISKVVLRGSFIVLNVYITKEEWSKIGYLQFCFKKTEKESRINPK